MFFQKTTIIAFALAAALLALLAAPLAAGAYCVYNHSSAGLFVNGGTCARCLQVKIHPDSKACCPGDDKGCRGHTRISFAICVKDNQVCNNFHVPKDVEAHGWVSFFGSCRTDSKTCAHADACDKLSVKVHDKDGNVTYAGGVRHD